MTDALYNYVFHYNYHTDEWHAIPRDLYVKYWDNRKTKGILRSKDIKTLVQWLCEKNNKV